MTAIWLLTTRGRPKLCQQVLDACEATGMASPGVVYVDETVDDYKNIRLPSNWSIHYERKWGSIAASMKWVFKNWPDASQYGWLADDTFPRSPKWDKRLEHYAGDWILAYGVDDYVSAEPEWAHGLVNGTNLGAPLCWGGRLVRAVGWWALPGVKQAGIDTAWTNITGPLGLYHYARDVHADHANWRTGRRPKDKTDSWIRGRVNYIKKDIAVKDRWFDSPAYTEAVERVKEGAGL